MTLARISSSSGFWCNARRYSQSICQVAFGSMRSLRSSRFQQSRIAKGEIASFSADNDVVQHINTEQFAGLHQLGGDGTVFLAGVHIAGRMIVPADDGGSVGEDCRLKNFTRID